MARPTPGAALPSPLTPSRSTDEYREVPSAAYRKRPLRRRYWVRQGSPLWALMGLLDFIGWIGDQMVEGVKWIESKVPDAR